MCEVCGDNRFEIIEKAKEDIIKSTNIESSPKEMKVLDNILFRAWQMGWLKKYEYTKTYTIIVNTNDGMPWSHYYKCTKDALETTLKIARDTKYMTSVIIKEN